jgi:P27 family predicted phage terminase small subunit
MTKPDLKIINHQATSEPFNRTPPDCLQEAGIAAWNAYYSVLHDMGVLTAADQDALTFACIAVDRAAEHTRIIEAEGEFYSLPNGSRVAHPACARRDKAEKQIDDFRRRMGMTASSRKQIKIQKKDELRSLPTRKRS